MDVSESASLSEPLTKPETPPVDSQPKSTADVEGSTSADTTADESNPRTWSNFVGRDWNWASEASHEMLVDWACPCLAEKYHEDKELHFSILYNPFYWLMWFPLVVCVVTGKWYHYPFGQSEAFEGETKLEREVRIQWIFACDGPMLMALLLDIVYVIYYWDEDDLGWNNDTLALGFSMGLCVGYLIGNTVFANAIREKKPRLVKVLIACNMAFATGLLVALCYGIYWHEDFQNSSHYRTYLVVASYTCRMVVVLFVLTACYIYWPLWSAYDDKLHSDPDSWGIYVPVIITILFIWGMLMLLVLFNYDDFWDALTR